MKLGYTSIYGKNATAWLDRKAGIRRSLNEGGTSSSKTYSIIQLLIDIAFATKEFLTISIISESLPHLKRGCIRDFLKIMGDSFNQSSWNKTESTYTFKNAIIEFFSADDSKRLRGGRRDILYINECNNVSYDSYRELDIRTRLFTFLDWNPVSEFWVHDNGLHNEPENRYIHSTYLDAKPVLPAEVVRNIESNKDKDPNWWNVYGLGKIGNVEGLVHSKFSQIDTMPDGGIVCFGLDFGFTNDPTALVVNKIIGENLYSDLLIYENGLTNIDIANIMQTQIHMRKYFDEIFADSAEPKSIEEIRRYGWNIKGCPKGPDSVLSGIQKINQFNQYWTKRSVEAIKEMRNYRYIKDKDGKLTNKPIDLFDHAIQARQYGVIGKIKSMENTSTVVSLKI